MKGTRIVITVDYFVGHTGRTGGGPDSWEPPEEDEINIEGISIGDDELGDVALESINESPDMYDALTRLVGEVIGEYEAEMEPDL